MVRRPYRPEMPEDPAAAIRSLRACRDAMIGIAIRVRIGGQVYQMVHAVIAAIDALAAELTAEADYFMPLSPGATEGQRKVEEEKAAWERGEIPWRK
ncbi:hypothetical protein [Methylocella silvestris]|uniref:Uncharacterized protein n=1 Tax=Methylocella silvestris TaxID=199596 RepID=A0A2J7TMB9_METSI|nr:hypothetical protein [Methylocella silvestris]PNG27904.1 hypothetical protein CR492_03175 [Methylocella silvestris]